MIPFRQSSAVISPPPNWHPAALDPRFVPFGHTPVPQPSWLWCNCQIAWAFMV
jgi:hypothetical protein